MRIVGHRGVRAFPGDARTALPPENTIAAFERGLSEGADAIELDVRLSKDDQLLVFHDPDLTRMAGDARTIAGTAYADLPLLSGERIPLLAEVLEHFATRAVVNVEIKYDFVDRRAIAWASGKIIRASRCEVIASSFDPRILGWLATRAPAVRRAWLANVTQTQIARTISVLARAPAFHAMHVERRLASPERIRMLRGRGLRVGVWTVNDPAEARDLFALGADWLITDGPGLLV
jgi:glycerophosphoryl diester phosphodiesterase